MSGTTIIAQIFMSLKFKTATKFEKPSVTNCWYCLSVRIVEVNLENVYMAEASLHHVMDGSTVAMADTEK